MAQLVARSSGGREVASSSLVAPMVKEERAGFLFIGIPAFSVL